MKTRKLKALFLNEEWLIVMLGFIILALIVVVPDFMINIKMLNVKSLDTSSGWINAAYTFVFLFLIILISALAMKKSSLENPSVIALFSPQPLWRTCPARH